MRRNRQPSRPSSFVRWPLGGRDRHARKSKRRRRSERKWSPLATATNALKVQLKRIYGCRHDVDDSSFAYLEFSAGVARTAINSFSFLAVCVQTSAAKKMFADSKIDTRTGERTHLFISSALGGNSNPSIRHRQRAKVKTQSVGGSV